jgi:hypothetical protein
MLVSLYQTIRAHGENGYWTVVVTGIDTDNGFVTLRDGFGPVTMTLTKVEDLIIRGTWEVVS